MLPEAELQSWNYLGTRTHQAVTSPRSMTSLTSSGILLTPNFTLAAWQ